MLAEKAGNSGLSLICRINTDKGSVVAAGMAGLVMTAVGSGSTGLVDISSLWTSYLGYLGLVSKLAKCS